MAVGGGFDRDDVKVKGVDSGGTDREILAVQDGSDWRLGVDAPAGSPGNGVGLGALSNKVRYEDMNASNGGVARGTTLTTTKTDIFSYSGSGLVFGFLAHLRGFTSDWKIFLKVDGDEIFTSAGLLTNDFTGSMLYGYQKSELALFHIGLYRSKDIFRWDPKFPMTYASSVTVSVQRTSGTDDFRAGLIMLSKET